MDDVPGINPRLSDRYMTFYSGQYCLELAVAVYFSSKEHTASSMGLTVAAGLASLDYGLTAVVQSRVAGACG